MTTVKNLQAIVKKLNKDSKQFVCDVGKRAGSTRFGKFKHEEVEVSGTDFELKGSFHRKIIKTPRCPFLQDKEAAATTGHAYCGNYHSNSFNAFWPCQYSGTHSEYARVED